MEDNTVHSDVKDESECSSEVVLDEETSDPMEGTSSNEKYEARRVKRTIPPPGAGKRIYDIDPYLTAHREHLDYR